MDQPHRTTRSLTTQPTTKKTGNPLLTGSAWPVWTDGCSLLTRQRASCDAETSPERGLCYSASQHSAGQLTVAGWSYQWINQLPRHGPRHECSGPTTRGTTGPGLHHHRPPVTATSPSALRWVVSFAWHVSLAISPEACPFGGTGSDLKGDVGSRTRRWLVGLKRVMGSAPIYDAVSTQDTVTMIRSSIRGLLKAAGPTLGAEMRAGRILRSGRA